MHDLSSESVRLNFGKYEIPADLQLLLSIEEEFRAVHPQGLDFGMGLIPELGSFRYLCTPSDVIVFGSNGCDGIHYGYLTDFGEVESLDQAPIVCISPMDFGETNKLIAGSFRDFLSIALTDSALFYNRFESEDAYRTQVKIWEEEALASPYGCTPEEEKLRKELHERLRKDFDLPVIENPYAYIKEIQAERAASAVVLTQDTLHIVTNPLEKAELAEEELRLIQQVDPESEEEVRTSLDQCSLPAALAIIRNVELSAMYETRVVAQQYLRSRGYEDEARRVGVTIQGQEPIKSTYTILGTMTVRGNIDA
ncbi:hypothetical protein PUW24_08715 [Paenibacillus urinalis]|uniref:SMI1/KNR4 family protein n=1 Tax=Paenibacillus urinalis TaxID=521520 RepID=A0AAX3N2R7_9BACL|nr:MULTISPECIES: hypothetical protein [Paenibacillus]WDH82912.1 hypothetical protein PUW23_01185 [Paenibacillus urinalis]WDH98959.1 hypothetical protein PUW24_08715 [Paenibacillus urinalis]WDI02655.1 hypothetical protein PUW25_01175 [Paenibacillus urinalis]GAK42938.1 hypothetical protein TCA2_5431 [Paenibacillus sp. TCA20]